MGRVRANVFTWVDMSAALLTFWLWTTLNPGYPIVCIPLLRTWNVIGTVLVSCIEDWRSCAVTDIKRAVQLTRSSRSLLAADCEKLCIGVRIISRCFDVRGKDSSTVRVFLSHETWIPTKKIARSTCVAKAPSVAHTKLLLIYFATTSTKRIYDTKPLSRMASNLEISSQLLKYPTWAKGTANMLERLNGCVKLVIIRESWANLYLTTYTIRWSTWSSLSQLGARYLDAPSTKRIVTQHLNHSSTSTFSAHLVWCLHYLCPNGCTNEACTDT